MTGRRFNIRTVVSILVMAGLALWAAWYIGRNFGQFRQALTFNPKLLAGLSLLAIGQFVAVGLFNRIVLTGFGLNLSFVEWFGLSVVTTLGNYLLPPRGGAGLRAAYLKKKRGLPLSHFLSTFVIFYALNLAVCGLAGLIALAMLPDRGPAGTVLFWFFALVLAGSVPAAVLPVRASWFDRRGLRPFMRLVEGWQIIRERPGLVGRVLVMVVVNLLIFWLMITLSYSAAGADLSLPAAAAVTALLSLTSLIALTPGGFGVQEAVLVFSTGALGVQPAQSLAAAVVIRVVILFWTFVLGPIFSWKLLRDPLPRPEAANGSESGK